MSCHDKSAPSFGSSRKVKQRVAEQLKIASIKNYTIELDDSAERDDGTIFSDHRCAQYIKPRPRRP
jgi:hypothetical protein